MLESQHHTIFYPFDRTKLDECTKSRPATSQNTTLPAAVLTPHAAYSMVGEALHRSFAHVAMKKPSLVVFLGPLHQEVLSEDEPAFLFAPEDEGITIAGFNHQFSTSLIRELCSRFVGHVAMRNSYFIEEPALELTLPFIQSYFPHTAVLPLVCGSCNKEQLDTYVQILGHITDQVADVLFVVSANANAILPAALAAQHAQAFVRTLLGGSSLQEGLHKHTISSCNTDSLEAITRQPWGGAQWDMLGFFLQGKEYDSIPLEIDETEKHVWHVSAALGDHHANQ